jgi:hypothetical protein
VGQGSSSSAPKVREPEVDASPRGVRVRVVEGVKCVDSRLEAEFEPVTGAVVIKENRDGVRVLCPKEPDPDPRSPALGKHDPGGSDKRVIVRAVHLNPSGGRLPRRDPDWTASAAT